MSLALLGADNSGAAAMERADKTKSMIRYGQVATVGGGVLGAVIGASLWSAHRIAGGLLGWGAGWVTTGLVASQIIKSRTGGR